MRSIFNFLIFLLQIHQIQSIRSNLTISLNGNDVDFEKAKCPQVINCNCVNDSTEDIECHGLDESILPQLLKIYGPWIRHLKFYTWPSEILHFDVFSPFSQLESLVFLDGEIETLNATKTLKSLKILKIENAEISSDLEVCHVIEKLPNLQNLSLRQNYLKTFRCEKGEKLEKLDLSRNMISHLELTDSVRDLNVSNNQLTSFENVSMELTHLDISLNSLSSWIDPSSSEFPNLISLSASHLNFQTGFQINAPLLETLNIDHSALRFIDLHQIQTPKLQKFSAQHLLDLRHVAGSLPDTVNDVKLTETTLKTLPAKFFKGPPTPGKRIAFEFSSNRLVCEPCLLQWSLPVFAQSNLRKTCNFTLPEIATAKCSLKVFQNETIQYGKYEDPSTVECLAHGDPAPRITWYRFRPGQKLGSYDPETNIVSYDNVLSVSRESYSIQPGGTLLIHSPNRSHVERYVCVVQNKHGKQYGIYKFRLDYLDWYSYDVFHSVFWGGLATSLIVCLVSFLLNVTWILTRKSALWWIQRAERLSRVRKMVEAMEKYRVRHMESLHDKYTKRVQIVRDNYHQQVEALRVSYAAQQEKFQNYRAAQVDAVHSHLDAMRDGYNNQLGRVREYGSKRAEQLWESYERQVNRMRTFSLQHRLKMMRQYKVKQRYVNKLLESFQASSPDVQLENEEKVRAALEIPDDLGPIDGGSMDTPSRLSRSSSFHSLPEYVIDEQGNVRPGIIPTTSSAAIRFSSTSANKPSTSGTSGPTTSSASSSSGYPRSPDDSPPKL